MQHENDTPPIRREITELRGLVIQALENNHVIVERLQPLMDLYQDGDLTDTEKLALHEIVTALNAVGTTLEINAGCAAFVEKVANADTIGGTGKIRFEGDKGASEIDLSADEYAEILQDASDAGMSVAAYVKKVIAEL